MAVAPSNFGVNVFGRYNSAIFNTQPTSSVKALVVTPGFVTGAPIDAEDATTNTFDCRKPNSWKKNHSMIENWNIIGYKIDYCLISEIPLSKLCSVQYSLPIMISTTHLNEYLD
jgi:hypothetical protein